MEAVDFEARVQASTGPWGVMWVKPDFITLHQFVVTTRTPWRLPERARARVCMHATVMI